MKKFRKIISIGLAAMMILSVMCVGVSAADEHKFDDNIIAEVTTITEAQGDVMPLGYPIPTRTPFYGQNTGYITFDISSAEPNFKIWVSNLSDELGHSSVYTIKVYAPDGSELPSFAVQPGGYNTAAAKVYNGYVMSGTYAVSIVNADGWGSVKGEITVKSERGYID